MGTFQGGRWFILMFVLLFMEFLIVFAVISAEIYYGNYDTDSSYDSNVSKDAILNAVKYGGRCLGDSTLSHNCVGLCMTTDAFYMDCRSFETPTECLKWENCNWTTSSVFWIFETVSCQGVNIEQGYNNVNLTFYRFPRSQRAGFFNTSDLFTSTNDFCEYPNTSLQYSSQICGQFGCEWVDIKNLSKMDVDISKPLSMVFSLKESLKTMFGLNVILDFGDYTWIYSAIFVWPFLIMLFYSFYMMIRGS